VSAHGDAAPPVHAPAIATTTRGRRGPIETPSAGSDRDRSLARLAEVCGPWAAWCPTYLLTVMLDPERR